jgi:uncharacterized protein (UPF0332 family)
VRGEIEARVSRAREELRAAEALLGAGFPSQALARAYLAGAQVARAALRSLGETPRTRTGVVSGFGLRVVAEGGLDHEVGRGLRRLFDDRDYVDHALGEASPEAARSAIADAERLVEATAAWIEEHAAIV